MKLCPAATATVPVAVPSTLPVPFGPSYKVIVIAGLPTGALTGIAQFRPLATVVQRVDVDERSTVVVFKPVTATVPDTTDGEMKRGRRCDAGTLVAVGMKIVTVPVELDAAVLEAVADEPPPPQPLANIAHNASSTPKR